MYPEIVTIGPITLYTFGAMMGLGFFAAAYLCGRELARRNYDSEYASNILLAAVIGGLAGSRLWAVANDWELFIQDPVSGLFTGAGFVWYGGLIGGALAVTVVFRRLGIPWLRGADCAAPGLALGQAIGRIGCHLAGDGDWGAVTDVPWGVAYTNAIIGWPHADGVLVHPTPLYEAAAYALVFALLWRLRRLLTIDGQTFALYLMTAPALRFLVEFLRINPPVFAGLSQAQLFSIGLVATGAVLMLSARETQNTPEAPAPAAAAQQ